MRGREPGIGNSPEAIAWVWVNRVVRLADEAFSRVLPSGVKLQLQLQRLLPTTAVYIDANVDVFLHHQRVLLMMVDAEALAGVEYLRPQGAIGTAKIILAQR